jgi:hypothetical protein
MTSSSLGKSVILIKIDRRWFLGMDIAMEDTRVWKGATDVPRDEAGKGMRAQQK